jgi:hypothetical protein
VQDVGVGRRAQVREGRLGQQECAPDVDVHHQVEFLGRELLGGCGRNGTGVVDDDVDAAEALYRGVDRALHVLLPPYVAHDRDTFSARLFDVGHGGVHGARQLGVWFGRLGEHDHVGALLGGAQCDRQPDTAAAARDDERAVSERGHGPPRMRRPSMVLAFSF